MWNKASKLVALIFGATLSFLGISTSATQAQTFETFYVSGNKALNTNWNFRRIDGFPRMSLWDRNDNDRDQQFERIRGNRGGTLLKHRSTGLCLNAHYLANSREVNTWTCDANDVDQNFNFQDLGGGTFLIKRNDSFCVDSPTRDNLGRIHLINCQANNVNQQWRSSNAPVVNPPPVNPPNTGFHRNFENFIRWAVGQKGIARLDPQSWDSRGQCVTLIARYVQEVYLSGSERTRKIAFGNAKDTARVVASTFSAFFLPSTSQGLPNRGAVVSFPDIGIVNRIRYGHVGIAMESRTLSNGQRQMRIMDSNGDSQTVNSIVREYYDPRWINIPNGSANGYGNNIYWTNPR
mgnify:CR=1 FL=1